MDRVVLSLKLSSVFYGTDVAVVYGGPCQGPGPRCAGHETPQSQIFIPGSVEERAGQMLGRDGLAKDNLALT